MYNLRIFKFWKFLKKKIDASLELVKKQMVEDSSLASIEEIIILDVQRSLYLHQNVISQAVNFFFMISIYF